MKKFALLTIAMIVASATAAEAQRAGPFPYDGDIQAYGAPWRYQFRDWSTPSRPLRPGVCWYWNDYTQLWKWEC
ncbi:hypothetical protein [Methylocystis parvus]|uniref:Uncharacterized protein n=1 Tax=Methylocystis parvus TaxID=134 RepID=A0A6B8MA45_9HYPH|nr:hypothetical protein [Methylocystis parvus]QGM98469.1 hypothetical protein F7D14_13965 [Methylocystis parvus]WBK01193.1 hypothetical protein MMG94_05605 [Methylocystis parvus OBBP]